MQIVVLSGSMYSPATTRATAKAAAAAAEQLGAQVTFLDVRDLGLPFLDGTPAPASVEQLRATVVGADALIVATPEYHGGISGSLKNALDWLGSKQLKDKPVAIFAGAGGGKGGINALNNLRIVLRATLALVLPGQVAVDQDYVNDQEEISDPAVLQRIADLVGQLYRIAQGLAVAKQQA